MTTKEAQEARAKQAAEDAAKAAEDAAKAAAGIPPTDEQPKQDGPPTTWDEIFNHPRFKALNLRAKEAETEVETQRQVAEDAKKAELEEQAKWKELYEAEQGKVTESTQRIAELEQKRIEATKYRGVEAAVRRHQPPFLEFAVNDVLSFATLDDVTIDDDGKVQGADAIVKAIAEKRPHWLDTKRQDPGSPPGRKPAPKNAEWSGPRITTL